MWRAFQELYTVYLTRFWTYKIAIPPQTKTCHHRSILKKSRRLGFESIIYFVHDCTCLCAAADEFVPCKLFPRPWITWSAPLRCLPVPPTRSPPQTLPPPHSIHVLPLLSTFLLQIYSCLHPSVSLPASFIYQIPIQSSFLQFYSSISLKRELKMRKSWLIIQLQLSTLNHTVNLGLVSIKYKNP